MKRWGLIRRVATAIAALAAVALCVAQPPDAASRHMVVMRMDGPIMPPTRDCFERALGKAVRDRAELLLIEM
ncbi:MAG: hypothetical protein FJX72_20365, partial [Armatimonadetes bacterium]|nr:hypothetical protein [Armatimonadota bacterium]